MYKEVKVYHRGISHSLALTELCSKLESLGLAPSLVINYEYIPLSDTQSPYTFLHIFLGGWDDDPENELKQRMAQLLDSEFEIHEGLLRSIKGSYPEGYAVIPKGAEVFEKVLYYEKGEYGYLVIPDSCLEIEKAFEVGLKEKLTHCFSKFHRRYQKRYWYEKERDIGALRLQFPQMGLAQEKVGRLCLLTARVTAPSRKSPENLFSLLDDFIEDALPLDKNFAKEAVIKLKKSGSTIALAESCTGGALAKAITEVPGASEVFKGSLVCYSNELKEKLLGVPAKLIKEQGAVSSEVSSAMCAGLQSLDSDYRVSITGTAGPTGGTNSKPIGTVWVTLQGPNGSSKTWNVEASGSRTEIISQTVQSVLTELLKLLMMKS